MEKHKFLGNPHALILDGVVTEVVYMHQYTQEEIEKELANHKYDEVAKWDDYQMELYVGYLKYGDKVAPPKPFPSWVLNDLNLWEAPTPCCPEVLPGVVWAWEEETLSWVVCEDCHKGCDDPTHDHHPLNLRLKKD
jgi:hypothetical protein